MNNLGIKIIPNCQTNSQNAAHYAMFLSKKKGSTPRYLVHISNISSKDLQNINNSAPMEQAYNKAVSPIHVRYLYGRCTVDVRYESGHVPDKYRTYSGQRQEMHRRYAGATIWKEWRYA